MENTPVEQTLAKVVQDAQVLNLDSRRPFKMPSGVIPSPNGGFEFVTQVERLIYRFVVSAGGDGTYEISLTAVPANQPDFPHAIVVGMPVDTDEAEQITGAFQALLVRQAD